MNLSRCSDNDYQAKKKRISIGVAFNNGYEVRSEDDVIHEKGWRPSKLWSCSS